MATLTGFNNDGNGFIQSLRDADPKWSPASGPILVLGAGGAARAVVASLAAQGATEIRLANRTLDKAREIADAVGPVVKVVPWDERADALDGVALLANATSLGSAGKPALEMPLDRLPEERARRRPHLHPAGNAAPGRGAHAREHHRQRPRPAAQSGASRIQRLVRRHAGDHARPEAGDRRHVLSGCHSTMDTRIFEEPKIDCHVHVLDPARFPYGENTHYRPMGQEMGTPAQLAQVMETYGTSYALLVGPNSGYGLDNSCMLDTLARGNGRYKGSRGRRQRRDLRGAAKAQEPGRPRRGVERDVLRPRLLPRCRGRFWRSSWRSTCSSTFRSSTNSS